MLENRRFARCLAAFSLLSACTGGSQPGATTTSNLKAPDAMVSTVAVDRTLADADGVEAVTVTVTATDPAGNPLRNWSVTLAVSGEGNAIDQPVADRPRNGVATGYLRSTVAGEKQIYVTLRRPDGSASALEDHPVVRFRTLLSITVAPDDATVDVGGIQQYTATGHYALGETRDLTRDPRLTWNNANTVVAHLSSDGLATGAAIGHDSITASLLPAIHVSNTASLTVSTLDAISVSPESATVDVGGTQQYSATGHYGNDATHDLTGDPRLTWNNSNSVVAHLSSTGQATGAAIGHDSITASLLPAVVVSSTATLEVSTLDGITVTPGDATVVIGGSQQYTATANYGNGATRELNGDPRLSWNNANFVIASLTSTGLATGLATGNDSITASLPPAVPVSNTAHLLVATVTPPACTDITFASVCVPADCFDANHLADAELLTRHALCPTLNGCPSYVDIVSKTRTCTTAGCTNHANGFLHCYVP